MVKRIFKLREMLMSGIRETATVIRTISTLEFLGLCTVLLPSLIASAGFFFGKTVTPFYFYVVVAMLMCCAFSVNWHRALSYFALLSFCAMMTAYTFSYVGTDAQSYHFPMQYMLRHGWNPVFDSTIEKFTMLAGDAQLSIYHTLFLPKFSSLCGAIAASAFGLFSGDGFLGYILIVCLFTTSVKFGERYWNAHTFMCVLFAMGITFSTKITSFLAGQVDYSTYASFCISAMMLTLYIHDNKLADLVVFAASSCVCMSSKSTGVLCCAVLVVMTFPLLYRRAWYWRTLFTLGAVVALIGASPLVTAWIQYGSPFYPSMTFNPNVKVVDITSDFTGNADALSMGYLSRICYAWISPKVTVSLIRCLEGNASFNPVFDVCGGVAGLGLWFNFLLLISAMLLATSKRNMITWLCITIFVSSNFAPLKYIGYNRYFPQIWAIFPLAVMNYIYTAHNYIIWKKAKVLYIAIAASLAVMLCGLSGLSLLRTLAYQGRMIVQESSRQKLIASLSSRKQIKVDGWSYRYTNVQRFKQAGVRLLKAADGKVDTVIQEDSALPCYDTHPEVYDDLNNRFPLCDDVKSLVFRFKWCDVFENMPNVLWDN